MRGQTRVLSRACYLAPIPMALRDREERVVAANLAFALLFGEEAGRGEGRPGADVPWPARAPETLPASAFTCSSRAFGKCELVASEIPELDPDTGEEVGALAFWETRSVESERAFRQALHWEIERHVAWEQYAISYDRALLEQAYYVEVVERHVRALVSPEIERVLDLGAGTGNVALRLLEAGVGVTAVDASRSMLDRLRAKAADRWDDRLVVVEASAESLGFLPTRSFDGVNVLLALFDITHPRRALDEAIRVLRPGGRLVLTEPRRDFELGRILAEGRRHLQAQGKWESLSADWERVARVNEKLDPTARRAMRQSGPRLFVEDLHDLLAGYGFDGLELRSSHFGQCATLVGRRPT